MITVIDKSLIALGGYILFSAILSFVVSLYYSSAPEVVSSPIKEKVSSPIKVKKPAEVSPSKKNKNERLIKEGHRALCIPCERYFEDDIHLKHHIDGGKHLRKIQGYTGEICKIVPIIDKKK